MWWYCSFLTVFFFITFKDELGVSGAGAGDPVSNDKVVHKFPIFMPKVVPTKEESYLCTSLRLNENNENWVVGFNPNVSSRMKGQEGAKSTDAGHIPSSAPHHMLLYGCKQPGSFDPVWNCGEMSSAHGQMSAESFDERSLNENFISDYPVLQETMMMENGHPFQHVLRPDEQEEIVYKERAERRKKEDDLGVNLEVKSPCGNEAESNIIYAWAHNAPHLTLPNQVGFRIGGNSGVSYLVLQVHYGSLNNIDMKNGDDSGIELLVTDQKQEKEAGVVVLAANGFAPSHSTTYFETACQIRDTRDIVPFAFRTHTHSLGKVVSGWKVRDLNEWTLLGKMDPQEAQMFYPVVEKSSSKSTLLKRGDVIAARCTMVNDKDDAVYTGQTNEDEMCNFYLMYYLDTNGDSEPSLTHQEKSESISTGGNLDVTNCVSRGPPTFSWARNTNLKNIPDDVSVSLL